MKLRTPEERERRMRLLEALGALSTLSAAVLIFLGLSSRASIPLLVFAADLCVVAFVFQLVTFIIGRSLRKRTEKGREEITHAPAAESPQLTPGDPQQFVRPPSVTEHTTELLEPGRLGRRGE